MIIREVLVPCEHPNLNGVECEEADDAVRPVEETDLRRSVAGYKKTKLQ